MCKLTYENPMQENAYDVPQLCESQCGKIEADSRMVLTTPEIFQFRRIIITGCGDSYAAGLSMKPALEELTGLPVEVLPAMELARYTGADTFGKPGSTLVMAVSNSGGVARVAEAVERATQKGCLTLAITGRPDSKLAKAAMKQVPLTIPPFAAGGGNGVRSYLISMLSLLLEGIRIGEVKGRYMMTDSAHYRDTVCQMARAWGEALPKLDAQMKELAREYAAKDLFDFLGSGGNLGTAWFAHAKIIEATGDAASYNDMESWMHLNCFLKNLPGKVTWAWVSGQGRDLSRAQETLGAIAQMPGEVCVVTDDATLDFGAKVRTICVPACPYEWMAPLLNYLPIALFAGYLCEEKGEAYGRGGRAEWAPVAGTALLTESKIVLV